MNKGRWLRLMDYWKWNENISQFENLISLHSQKHRKYHNGSHVEDCLLQLDSVKNIDPDIYFPLELSFWFHDAIYNPYKKNNELKSAELGEQFLIDNHATADFRRTIWNLILITKHVETPQSYAQSLMMDIDVSILGRDPERYHTYAKQIRNEYKWVPWIIYKNKRKAILSHFLERSRIYDTKDFYDQYEDQARDNLKKELETLT